MLRVDAGADPADHHVYAPRRELLAVQLFCRKRFHRGRNSCVPQLVGSGVGHRDRDVVVLRRPERQFERLAVTDDASVCSPTTTGPAGGTTT